MSTNNRIIATALGIALAASPCVMASTTAFAVESGDNATVSVQAATEPSVGDFLTAASQVKVYVNGTEYKDFDYMKGIDATKLMTTKKAEATYTGIPYGATVEVRNIPENMKDYIKTVKADNGVDVVASASGYTVTYHFVYAPKADAGDTTPTLDDLLAAVGEVKVYVNGTEYKDFSATKGIDQAKLKSTKKAEATYTGIPNGAELEVRNIPSDMKNHIKLAETSKGADLTASTGDYTVTYHFIYDTGSTTDPTTPSKPGTGSTTDPSNPGSGSTDKPGTGDNTGSTTDPTTPSKPSTGDNTDNATSGKSDGTVTPDANGTATNPEADLATTGTNVSVIAGAVAILAALGAGLAFILHRGGKDESGDKTEA